MTLFDDAAPKGLPERSGEHRCVNCLAPAPSQDYFANDFLCNACAANDAFPLASTPGVREESGAPEKTRPSPDESTGTTEERSTG